MRRMASWLTAIVFAFKARRLRRIAEISADRLPAVDRPTRTLAVTGGIAVTALAQLTVIGVSLRLSLWVPCGAAARLRWKSLRVAAGGILIATAATAFGARTVRIDWQLTRSSEAELDRRVSCATCNGVEVSDCRRVFLGLLNDERAHDMRCAGRRVFATSRWVYPLDLQSTRCENLVFGVRGSSCSPRVERKRQALRQRRYETVQDSSM